MLDDNRNRCERYFRVEKEWLGEVHGFEGKVEKHQLFILECESALQNGFQMMLSGMEKG